MLTADYTLQPAWIISCYIQYISAFRNRIRVQQWGMGMSITEEEDELRPRQGSMSPRQSATMDKFTLRLTTLSTQLESALAQYSTFPVSWAHFQRMMCNTYCVLNNMRWCGLIWIAVTICGECFPHVWNDSDSFRFVGKQVSELRSGTCSFFRNSYTSIHHGKGLGTSVL